jgi:aminoglycoside N3'-acetyltransferase
MGRASGYGAVAMGSHPDAVGRAQLQDDLRRLGLRDGAIAMVHTRMSALGWVVGGSETVVPLAGGAGVRGQVGQAECQLFDAAHLTRFAVEWLQARFCEASRSQIAPG